MRLLLGLWLLAAVVVAGPPGFASLKILPGAREAGMAGTGVASAQGPAAIALNPCADAGQVGFCATAAYTKWLLDTKQQALFVARGFSFMRFTAGVVSFSAGEFEYRTRPTEQPIGTFTPTDLTAYLNASRAFGSMVRFGITGRYYYTRIMEHDGSGIGVDAGLRVMPVKGLCAGASFLDFGKTVTYYREVFWLPTRARVGLSYALPASSFQVVGAVDGSYFIYTRSIDVRAGLELEWNRHVALRAGYAPRSDSPLSLGLGARAGAVRLDYAFSPLGFDLGSAHRFAVTLGH